MLKDVAPYLYIFGFALMLVGEVRTNSHLTEMGQDAAKGMKLSFGITLGLLIGGVIQFHWWFPLASIVVAFVLAAIINGVVLERMTFSLNKVLFILGTSMAVLASWANQA